MASNFIAYRLYAPVASDDCETATQTYPNASPEGKRCAWPTITQRSAILSYCATGSAIRVFSHSPPSFCQIALMPTGPIRSLPVLSNTASDELTTCTYCVLPAAPVGSGAALLS